MKAANESEKIGTHVPGQHLGYSLQTTRCLALLLEAAPGSSVSIEVFEDVGLEHPDGTRVAEQDKTARRGNSVTDRSPDLWKTFANWIDCINAGELDPGRTRFVIYLSTPRSGEIVEGFHEAQSASQAQAALDKAKLELWGTPPVYEKRETVSTLLQPLLDKVFSANEALMQQIICGFTLAVGSGSTYDDVRASLARTFVPPEILDDALHYALGWVKSRTDALIESDKPAIVSVDVFRNAVTSFLRKHDRRTILTSVARAPSQEQIDNDLKVRRYVRQLEIIDCEDDDLVQAVIDYQLAAADRTAWSADGSVDEKSFSEFEDSLMRRWSNSRRETFATQTAISDERKGQAVYARCMDYAGRINGLGVPGHFTPGSFHSLADEPRLGWHPDYKERLELPRSAGGDQ